MKSQYKIAFGILLFIISGKLCAQHHSKMDVSVDMDTKIITVKQELTFFNESPDTINHVILNDWNNAYSSKDTPLAKRFSDEFIRSFHLAKKYERGSTNAVLITLENGEVLNWSRPEGQPDLVKIDLGKPLLSNEKTKLLLSYSVKIPSAKFTGYGFSDKDKMNLKNWFLAPARFENHAFAMYSNTNSDDISNALSDYEINFNLPANIKLTTDLDVLNPNQLSGKNRTDFSIFLTSKQAFENFKNDVVQVTTDLNDNRVDAVQKALVIDRITKFVSETIGKYPFSKITVSQSDYDKNPFYGLNQLPSFISPFKNDFLFEIKFLKTYINNYLKNTLRLDPRKENWIYDGIQIYTMMNYMDEFYPEAKMMGNARRFWLVRNYRLTNLPFNEQYSYFYLLMARKNLDQPLSETKDNLIKFNEQIAGKYRSGLSFRYLADYIGTPNLNEGISEFYIQNSAQNQIGRASFESILKSKTSKNINWFFDKIIDTREIIDYKFGDVSKTNDSVTFRLINKANVTVPVSVYGIKDKQVVFKKWIDNPSQDSTFTFAREGAERLAINYRNEIPEYNLRNNWHSLKGFSIGKKPFKFTLMKDLEDPNYNQVIYVPTVTYNLYDGLSPGLRVTNKTLLDKPFIFSVNPTYSPNTQSLIGNFMLSVNQNNRNSDLYNIRYNISGSYFHYAPDAAYRKLNPSIFIRFRNPDFRDNRKQLLLLRNVMVEKDYYEFDTSGDVGKYNVFNIKYYNTKTETIKHFNFVSDLQFANNFGKAAVEFEFRRLFNDNRQISLRLFAGTFLYRKTTSDYFNFALDRPTDYMFDYDFYGRSEKTGFFSQQLIVTDGGFKSKLANPFANQWMTTANMGFNVWNWIEVYGDLGLVKNQFRNPEFVYDSGVRLNLVTDYFEMYFPVYSNNGWEIAQPNYNEKVRFILTLDPRILVNLFTRKWF